MILSAARAFAPLTITLFMTGVVVGCGGKSDDTTPTDAGIDVSGDGLPTNDTSSDTANGNDGAAPACPATAPANGSACAPVGRVCGYGEDIRPGCRTRATCSANGWQFAVSGCPPVPGNCPASQPQAGATCDKDGMVCGFGDTTCACSACSAGPCSPTPRWSCASPPSDPNCPRTVPNLGTPCSVEGTSCTYGSCGPTHAGRKCQGGIWVELPVACPV